MAHDNTRGKFYDPVADYTFDMGVVTDEDISLTTGVTRVAIPFTQGDSATQESIKGRLRVITVEGFKFGTQLAIETFIKQFTDRADVNGFTQTIQYFPLFHHEHYAGTEGQQTSYFDGLINNFSYRASRDEGGFVLYYEVEFFHGTRVKDFLESL